MAHKINQSECIACGMCVEVCKFHAITIVKTHGYAKFIINDNCIDCGDCKANCLDGAIKDE